MGFWSKLFKKKRKTERTKVKKEDTSGMWLYAETKYLDRKANKIDTDIHMGAYELVKRFFDDAKSNKDVLRGHLAKIKEEFGTPIAQIKLENE